MSHHDELRRYHEEQRQRVEQALGISQSFLNQMTADEAAYRMMLYKLSRLTGQTEATIDAYVRRYQAQWVTKPEPAPDWRIVETEILRRVSLGEPIDWSPPSE